jgi:hypothetical protein
MLKTLDADLVRKLLEGVEDVITPAVEVETKLYREARCPRCFQSGYCVKKTAAPKIVATPHGPEVITSPFAPNRLLADGFAHCTNCDTEFCPRSGIIRHVEPFLTAVQPTDLPQT